MKECYKSFFIILFVLTAIVIFGCVKQEGLIQKEVFEIPEKAVENITISIVYDNNEFNPELRTGWGFSCVVRLGNKNILFDTGADSPTLLSNMQKMKIKPEEIDMVVLSHIHGDHVGGLDGFLNGNNKVNVYLPSSFPASFKNKINSIGANVTEMSKSVKIMDNVYSTGELGTGIIEQSMIINTEKGLIVVTGCAHPGIVNIVRKAKELLNKNIYLVFGGFHLGWAGKGEIENIIEDFRQLGVEKAGPCHCSGDRARELFKQEYKDDFVEIGVGKVIEIST